MRWTEDKLAILRERYPNEDNQVIAQSFGITRAAVAQRAAILGLAKTAEFSFQYRSRAGMAHKRQKAAAPSMVKRKPREETIDLPNGRKIATGTVYINGNVLTHIPHVRRGEG